MTIKRVYVNPGEMLDLRIVDEDFDRTAAGWREQLRPQNILLTVDNYNSITVTDPSVNLQHWRG